MLLFKRQGVMVLILGLLISLPCLVQAQTAQELQQETQALKAKLEQMHKMMEQVQEQLQKTEKQLQDIQKNQKWNSEDIQDLDSRVSKNEMHTAKDKVNLSIELEPRVWSIHMQDALVAPSSLTSQFFVDYPNGFNGASLQEIGQMMQYMKQNNMIPAADKVDIDNDAIRTLKFRLRLDSKVNNNLRFAGRLAVYKVWGDSVGINFNKAGMHDVTMDGTTASNPHGDNVYLERAYFVYKSKIGKLPWYFSVGRRPSTEGALLQYKNNSPLGGSPHGHIINWQFDGASLHFGLEDILGIPGAGLKFCYGSAFESQYGTTGAFLSEANMDDVDLYGVIGTLFNDDQTKISFNYAYAPNITDGFTGLTVMPFIVSKDGSGAYTFTQNTGMFVTRTEPTSKIGDWQALSLAVESQLMDNKLHLYLSGAWSHTKPEKVSKNPFYEIMGMSLLSSNNELDSHDGYSFWGGVRYDLAKTGSKFGMEYNYGSRYWFNFTGAEDNLIGSKLATRGHVLEPYLIQSILNNTLFIKAGAQFYWFEYTGSGNPLGKPVDIDDATGMDAIFPVVDKMQQYYLSIVYRY